MTPFEKWLAENGLGSYESVFSDNKIDFDVIHQMTDADLRELGLALGDRKRLLQAITTANRMLVGTGIAAVSEEGGGILSGDAVERGSKRLSKSLDGARSDPPQIGLHLGPARFDRAEVRAVAGQIAIGKA